MKKTTLLILAVAAAAAMVSCRQLSRNNPYDPSSPGYIHITYKNEAWYPSSTAINAMAFSGGYLYIAGVQQGTGDCIIKLVDAAGTTAIASTPLLGAFSGITDICADDAGNIYIVDSKQAVQVLAPSGIFTNFTLPNMAASGSLHIEWLAGNIFISNATDLKIYKYSQAGVPAVPDSKILSCTANGYFTPGRIFKIGTYIFVVNNSRKNEVVRLAQDLSDAGTYLFQGGIEDCADTVVNAQALSSQAVFKVDSGLVVALKWGDYGEGPGKIINGKLITYDPAGKLIYLLDGGSIKIFGE
jgi:hypothetical protein